MKQSEHIYVGFDAREELAAAVCKFSFQRRSTVPLLTEYLDSTVPGYDRPYRVVDDQRVDKRDGQPFSTDFSFARFLVPYLQDYAGWALFCDCDFLFVADVAQLFAWKDESKAAMVVQHLHLPSVSHKMDGQVQSRYPRKNWSSLVLWNCGHPSNRALTLDVVNHTPGRMLHGFKWLEDEEIGRLPGAWNHLAGYDNPSVPPKAIHYTEGGPWFPAYENGPLADEWKRELEVYRAKRQPKLMEVPHGASEYEAANGVL